MQTVVVIGSAAAGGGARPGMLAGQWVQAFSRQVMALQRQAHEPMSARWLAQALAPLAELVPFSRAWWGQCSSGADEAPPTNWLHGSLHLALSFGAEWNEVGQADRFARQSLRHLGQVCRSSGHRSAGDALESFSRRHDIFHAMAISMDLPASGFRFFVSVYRGEHERAFSELEAMVFGEFCQHLMQLWQQRVWESLGLSQAGEGDQRALCDAQGRLIYLGRSVAQTLARHLNNWQGEVLPGEWLDSGPAPRLLPLGAREALRVQRQGELLALALGPAAASPLPPRELAVAWRFAQGQSHKAIALELGLSPATVRTYLRDAYQRLGVDSRVALIHRLAALDGAVAS